MSVKRKLSIEVVTDPNSWMKPYIYGLIDKWREEGFDATVNHSPSSSNFDIVFYLSYGHIVPKEKLQRAKHNLVVHGSNLPSGKGWSPWSWQILEGRNRLCLTLFEAVEKMDSGRIYEKTWLRLDGTELIDEWQAKQADATIELCRRFVAHYPEILDHATCQVGEESFYPRRRAVDSELDISRTILDQINLLRIVDNERYPAFFMYKGEKYVLEVKKAKKDKQV